MSANTKQNSTSVNLEDSPFFFRRAILRKKEYLKELEEKGSPIAEIEKVEAEIKELNKKAEEAAVKEARAKEERLKKKAAEAAAEEAATV